MAVGGRKNEFTLVVDEDAVFRDEEPDVGF